jgi:hypothetical protein
MAMAVVQKSVSAMLIKERRESPPEVRQTALKIGLLVGLSLCLLEG